MPVLDGKNGILQYLGDLVVTDHYAPFQREAANRGTVISIELRHDVGLVVFQLANLGKVGRIDKYQTGQGAESRRQEEQGEQDQLPEDSPADQPGSCRDAAGG